MIMLYHGSNETVQKSEIRKSTHKLDFGMRAYATISFKQVKNRQLIKKTIWYFYCFYFLSPQ